MEMQQFIKDNNIKMTSQWTGINRNAPTWTNANHFKVALKHKGRQFTTYFSQGYGINGDPKAEDVLNCLAIDSANVDNCIDFADWAADMGFDPHDKEPRRLFKLCEKQAKRLEQLLGDELYQALLYDVESL